MDRLLSRATDALRVVWVHGVGGVGKSTLLREVARRASAATMVAWMSLDVSEARPRSLLAGVAGALGVAPPVLDLGSVLASAPNSLIFLDTFEAAASLESWLLDEAARTNAPGLVVVGSRDAPSLRWESPHLSGRFEALELANFDSQEAARFLADRGVPSTQHAEMVAFTRGHPLALSVLARAPKAEPPLRLVDSPNALRALLETLVGGELTDRQRAALEAASIAPRVNEPMLAAMLDEPDVYELVRWLQSRSYVSASSRGLAVHDLVRDVVASDLAWRNPDLYQRYMIRACDVIVDRMHGGPVLGEQQAATAELLWMVRRERGYADLVSTHEHLNATLERFADSGLYLDDLSASDADHLQSLMTRCCGPRAAEVMQHWVRVRPSGVSVARGADRAEVHGVWLELPLWDLPSASIEADEATSAIAKQVRRLKIGKREAVVIQRFYVDAVSGRDLGPTTPLSPAAELRTLSATQDLALRFIVAPREIGWGSLWEALGYRRLDDVVFAHDGVEMAVWQLDLRGTPVADYIRSVFARMITARQPSSAPARVSEEADLLPAVRLALRVVRDPVELARSPLALLVALPPESADGAGLREVLIAAIDSLGGTSRGERWKRAILETYLAAPAPQEAIAERLGVPFRTYRDHLTQGVQELARRLPRRASPS